MRASELDRQIEIQRAIFARDSFNNAVPTSWNSFAKVRAKKLNVSDGERIAAQEVGADITLRFQIRWNSKVATINAKDRIVFEGKTYGILGVKELGRRVGREITATTRID